MNATALDTITQNFVNALQAGQATLAAFSIPLLGVFAIIAFYVQMGPLLAGGGAGTGEALASLLLLVLKVGIFDWILFNFSSIATAAFDTFLQWGLSPAGVRLSAGSFQQPSVIVDLGFTAAKPLKLFADRMAGWSALWNISVIAPYIIGWWLIVIAFLFVALHLMMTVIEYHMAVLVGTVLVPWGVLQPTAFFTEFSLGWITGGLVRILVTGAMVGIAVPLFDMVMVTTTAGGDPTFYSAVVTALTSLGDFLKRISGVMLPPEGSEYPIWATQGDALGGLQPPA